MVQGAGLYLLLFAYFACHLHLYIILFFFLIMFKWLHDSGVIYSVYTGKKVPQDSEDNTSPIGKHNIQQLLQKIRGIMIFHCNDYAWIITVHVIIIIVQVWKKSWV